MSRLPQVTASMKATCCFCQAFDHSEESVNANTSFKGDVMFLSCTQLGNIRYLVYNQMAFILSSRLYFLFYLFMCMSTHMHTHTHRSAYHGARVGAENTLQETSSLLCVKSRSPALLDKDRKP